MIGWQESQVVDNFVRYCMTCDFSVSMTAFHDIHAWSGQMP